MKQHHIASVVVLLGIFIRAGVSWGFTVPIHREITKEKLKVITANVAGKPRKFSERALDEIMTANAATDHGLSAALFAPERHFTDERFALSSQRLIDLKKEIITSLQASTPNGQHARELLGGALHTVQDFYSHSNWVELGNSAIDTNFGRAVVANPAASSHPCPTDVSVLGLTRGQ